MARFKPGERPAWSVTLSEHVIAGRWTIPAREETRFEQTAPAAKAQVIRDAHIDAGVPALRSLLRQSWQYAFATQTVYHPG